MKETDFASSSCTSGCESCSEPRYQSSNRECSGHCGGFHSSPMFTAVRASMAANSASHLGWASPPETVINNSTSFGAPSENSAASCDATLKSYGISIRCNVQDEEWEVSGDLPGGKAPIVALKLLAAVALCNAEGPGRGTAEVTPFTRKKEL